MASVTKTIKRGELLFSYNNYYVFKTTNKLVLLRKNNLAYVRPRNLRVYYKRSELNDLKLMLSKL